MIKLEDQRQILCKPEIAPLMVEFAKTFNAQICKISFVSVGEKLLDLEEAVALICEGKTMEIPGHEITSITITSPKEVQKVVADKKAV